MRAFPLMLVLSVFSQLAPAAPLQYALDPAHTFPSLEFSHLGISIWRGQFERSEGEVVLDREARSGRLEVRVHTASIDFGLEAMNAQARKPEWLDSARHPVAYYRGTVHFEGDTPRRVTGELTLRGTTRPLELIIRHFACIPHPLNGRELCGADAEGSLRWSEYGMPVFGKGDSDRVRLLIQVEGQPVANPSDPPVRAPSRAP